MKRLIAILTLIAAHAFPQGGKVLHPDFPIVEGKYQMTKEWSLVLPEKFNRRSEDGSLVLWHPGFTMWISIWGSKNKSISQRISRIKSTASLQAFDREESKHGEIQLYSYQLNEPSKDKRQPAFHGFASGKSGDVIMAIYFDKPSDLKIAKNIFKTLNEQTAP